MKKRIVIVGGDSFIACNFIQEYKNQHELIVFSRQKTVAPNEIVMDDFFSIDLSICSDFDALINFAAIVHNSKAKKTLFERINAELPIYLAKRAKEYGIKQFVQMSTIAVYGNITHITVNAQKIPDNYYAISKLHAEKGLLNLKSPDFKITIIRPSMIYGGGNAPGNMIRLIRLVNLGIPLPFKKAEGKRNFLHIRNCLLTLNYLVIHKKDGEFLLADEKGVTTHELIQIINKYLGRKDRQYAFPLLFFRIFFPGIYRKLFQELIVENNTGRGIPENYTIEHGIEEMISFIKNPSNC